MELEALCGVLRNYDFDVDAGPLKVTEIFGTTHYRFSKCIVVNAEGRRLFVGPQQNGRSKDAMEARLEAAAVAVDFGGDSLNGVTVCMPMRRKDGTFLTEMSIDNTPLPLLFLVCPVVLGEQIPVLDAASHAQALLQLSRAVGGYHGLMMRGDGRGYERCCTNNRALAEDVAAGLMLAQQDTKWSDDDRLRFDEMLKSLKFFLAERRQRLDHLPCTWTHEDLQLKNLLHSPETNTVTVVDLKQGVYASRLYDFFFMLTGGLDDNSVQQMYRAPLDSEGQLRYLAVDVVKSRFKAYYEGGGSALSSEERILLINVLLLKAARVARYYAQWYHGNDGVQLFRQTSDWHRAIFLGKDTIRAAAAAATTEYFNI